ncbi:hypothetical protein [Alkalihalobacillus sp. TS-13]|uniref:5' nucleotidase, NT5C type n=1 Tax=Alkalihalobacillus sp. TS-13 TaxID=2842455 RepID=UPI001C883FE0|nr:hypothetical protein [Alkalihalobacillus sp. TS-13]
MDLYNQELNEALSFEDLQGTRLWNLRPHLKSEVLAYVEDPGFFRDLEVMEGSQEVIKELNSYYEIFITTSATEHRLPFLQNMN